MEVDSAEIQRNHKRRRPWLAFLLSFIAPGLGQLYNGQLYKSLIFIFYSMPFLLLAPLAFKNYNSLILILMLNIIMRLLIPVEAVISSRRIHRIIPRRYNRCYVYILLLVLIPYGQHKMDYAIAKHFVLHFMHPFKITTGSMQPNIEIGDRIMVDMTYDVSPEAVRGDIVALESPDGNNIYIKRIIALPKERVTIYEGIVYINGQPLDEPWELVFDPNFYIQAELSAKYAVGDEYIVPDGHVFLLGDNRDCSLDSRHWGAVDVNKIKGKLLYIFWSDDMDRIGQKFE